MSKNLIIVAFSLIVLSANPAWSSTFNSQQKKVLNKAYSIGKPYGYGYELAAIAWKESSAGINLENPEGPAYGVFQIFEKTALDAARMLGIKSSSKEITGWIKDDIELCGAFAVHVLKTFESVHKKDRFKTIASYYDGGIIGEAGVNYANDIYIKVDFLIKNNDWMK